MEVKAADIQNAYITAPVIEKIWTTCGPEFGSDAGKRAYIVRALYGLKSARYCYTHHMRDCMRTLGWNSCLADQDVWMKADTKPDGTEYYAYLLWYVDDALCIHHDAEKVLRQIDRLFKMKPGSIGDPKFYLGAKLKPMRLNNGVICWSFSSSKYVQVAVQNVKDYLKANNLPPLEKNAPTPFKSGYEPMLDTTPELDYDRANYFQSQIGMLRWMVELGRVDMITEVSLLSSHLALPREGHLEALFHIYAYLARKHNARMAFDPSYPDINLADFKLDQNWKAIYGDVQEPIPPNAPKPRGKPVDLRLFVDSDHAGDKVTRRSRTGFYIFMNNETIVWQSRKQATVETSVFGAEFVALKFGMDTLRGIRYKLRMMGIELTGPSYVYGDNMSVIHNTQTPESVLKKKSNSVCYHAVRESAAMKEILTGYVPTGENPADPATKVLPGGCKRDYLLSKVIYDLDGNHGDD